MIFNIFFNRYTSKEEIKNGLVEECFRRFGRDVVIKHLPHVLQKLQFLHIFHALEQQNFISHHKHSASSDKQHDISPTLKTNKQTYAEVSAMKQTPTNINSLENFISADENTELKIINQERHHYRRSRSKSPNSRRYESKQTKSERQVERSGRGSRQSSIDRVLEKQTSQQSDEVFIHNETTHHSQQVQFSSVSQTMRRTSSSDYRNDSPPPNYNQREEHFRGDSFSRRHNEEAQPLNPKKSSSRGSDSAQGGSISSPDAASPGHLPTTSILHIPGAPQRSISSSQGSTIGPSMFCQVGSDEWKDSRESEMSQTFFQSNTRRNRYLERCDGYPEVMEELLPTSGGPLAMDKIDGNKSQSRNRSTNRSMSPNDSEETKRKELYVQTVV